MLSLLQNDKYLKIVIPVKAGIRALMDCLCCSGPRPSPGWRHFARSSAVSQSHSGRISRGPIAAIRGTLAYSV